MGEDWVQIPSLAREGAHARKICGPIERPEAPWVGQSLSLILAYEPGLWGGTLSSLITRPLRLEIDSKIFLSVSLWNYLNLLFCYIWVEKCCYVPLFSQALLMRKSFLYITLLSYCKPGWEVCMDYFCWFSLANASVNSFLQCHGLVSVCWPQNNYK